MIYIITAYILLNLFFLVKELTETPQTELLRYYHNYRLGFISVIITYILIGWLIVLLPFTHNGNNKQ